MASRVLSRRAKRDENDAAERTEPEEVAGTAEVADDDDSGDEASEEDAKPKKKRTRKAGVAKVPKVKVPAKPRVRKKAVKVAPRQVARWAVCDGGLKRLAVFEYKDRAGADAKLAEIRERKTGTFVLLMVKDPYDPPPEPTAEPVVAV